MTALNTVTNATSVRALRLVCDSKQFIFVMKPFVNPSINANSINRILASIVLHCPISTLETPALDRTIA
jgi:hypothetical protein